MLLPCYSTTDLKHHTPGQVPIYDKEETSLQRVSSHRRQAFFWSIWYCHKVWDCTLHSSDPPLQSPSWCLILSKPWITKRWQEMLLSISRAWLCLQERAPALYPRQPGNCILPSIAAIKGSATESYTGDNTAADRWGEQDLSSSYSYISSAKPAGANNTFSQQRKETQGHNWNSVSIE